MDLFLRPGIMSGIAWIMTYGTNNELGVSCFECWLTLQQSCFECWLTLQQSVVLVASNRTIWFFWHCFLVWSPVFKCMYCLLVLAGYIVNSWESFSNTQHYRVSDCYAHLCTDNI